MYAYFVSKGYEILDDVEAYDGIHGVFIHEKSDGGYYAKVGYHEGLVESSVWLAVQDKKSNNITFPKKSKVGTSWLVGLVKCRNCGYSVVIDTQTKKKTGKTHRYLVDYGYYTVKGCLARSYSLRLNGLEETMLQAMRDRLETLSIAKKQKDIPDAETESAQNEIIRIDGDIHKLMDRMADADDVVFDYIQQKIKELHAKKSELERKLQTKVRKHKEIDTKPLENPMNRWDELTLQEKHELASAMIEVIYISHENNNVEINFSI